jgi:hypothetical protein
MSAEHGLKIPVPEPDAAWIEIWTFALTYDGHDRFGGFEGASRLGNATAAEWRNDGRLSDSLAEVRCSLFFEQRQFHHFGRHPGAGEDEYVRVSLRAIRDDVGAFVEGPADELP